MTMKTCPDISPAVRALYALGLRRLGKRRSDCIIMAACGFSVDEIADNLGLRRDDVQIEIVAALNAIASHRIRGSRLAQARWVDAAASSIAGCVERQRHAFRVPETVLCLRCREPRDGDNGT